MRLGVVPSLLLVLLSFIAFASVAVSAASSAQQVTYKDYSYNGVCVAKTGSFTPSLTSTIGITLIALDLAFDVVAIAYIVGRVFRHSGVLNWLQGEYYELTKSAFLVVAIYGLLTIVSGLSVAIAPSSTPAQAAGGLLYYNVGTLITNSESYLCSTTTGLLPGWTFIGDAAIGIGLVQGAGAHWDVYLYFPIPLPIPGTPGLSINSGFSMSPYQNFMLESGNIVIQHFESIVFDLVQFVLFPVTAMLTVLINLLPLIVAMGLSVFIPMGLILRAFPFVRGVGGTLIAIGIAASIIFPALLLILDQPVATWANNIVPAQTSSLPACTFGDTICKAFVGAINSFAGQKFAAVIGYAWDGFNGIYPFMNGMVENGWYVTVQLILFALDLIIMYSLTDSIARMLGGSIRLSLGGKLRMA